MGSSMLGLSGEFDMILDGVNIVLVKTMRMTDCLVR